MSKIKIIYTEKKIPMPDVVNWLKQNHPDQFRDLENCKDENKFFTLRIPNDESPDLFRFYNAKKLNKKLTLLRNRCRKKYLMTNFYR
jgi:hypothetical protein